MKRLLAWIVVVWGLFFGAQAWAASFDCAKASTKVEKLICENSTISKLDDELSKVYQDDLLKANEEQKQRLIAEQKHWLKYTRNVCADEPCFKHAYWSRMAELATFFGPHSPLYKKEADKAEAIKEVLTTNRFEASQGTTAFCHQMFDDLKQMNGIEFVDPIVQVQSYEDPALDPWKRQCKGKKGPLHFSYTCDGHFASLYTEDIPDLRKEISAECAAGYGLPPFKLFELSPIDPSQKKHYVFYSDDAYGPTNQEWKKSHVGGGWAGFYTFIFPECQFQGSLYARGGARNGPNYNSVIKYLGQYYLVNLYKEYADLSYRLAVEPVIQQPISSCSWYSPITSDQGGR
ncbi:MAG: lysozyme inhibitor LprI family protein [Desulfobulbia bacterium]